VSVDPKGEARGRVIPHGPPLLIPSISFIPLLLIPYSLPHDSNPDFQVTDPNILTFRPRG
ncbi:hypothetical protein, partial [Yersinia pestis]|uniref:hypothetical protein n=1 Tax=Yersinia pestis TaxID=632 RepID=UPI001ED9AD58